MSAPISKHRTVRRPPRTGGLAWHLIVPIAAVALPLILMDVGIVWAQYRAERSRLETQLVDYAASLGRLVDREFTQAVIAGQILARSTALARGDLGAFATEMRATRDLLSARLPENALALVSLRDAQGDLVFNTDGRTHVAGIPLLPQVLRVLTTGRPQISNLYMSPRTATYRVGIAVPIRAPGAETGPIVGVIGIMIPRARFRAIVAEAGLPPGAAASVQDRLGVTVARSTHDRETMGQGPEPIEHDAILRDNAGLLPQADPASDKSPATIAFAHAPDSGFIVRIDVPEQVFVAQLHAALVRTAGISSLVAAAGLLLAWLATRRILTAFHRVPAAARAGAAGGGIVPMTLGLHEADQLAALLAAAFAAHTRAAADARALFVNSPIGIVMVDAGGTVREANDAFLRMTRRPLDDITSGDLRWDSVVPVEWHARNAAAIATTLLGTRPEPIEQECSRPDGTRVPVLVSFGPTQHDAGLVAIFVVNLTDRRAAEATLRQMVAQQRLFIDKAPVGIAIFDREMRYLAASRRFIQDRRLPIDDPSDLIGWSHYDVMPEMPPAWRDVHRRVLAGETLAAEEYAFTDAEGRTEWLRWEMTPWPRPDGTIGGALLFSEQITERKQTALALRQSEAQLQHLAKMEAIGNLTGGMAHDFNNLLGVIIGNLDLAQPLVADIPQAHELIGDALAGALRGADLIQRLLAFARRQPLHPQRVAINPLIRRMVRLFARLLGEDIQIMLELTDDTWPVVADAAQIESALANLAANARDAMPSGGRLTIATRNQRIDAALAGSRSDITPGDYVMIDIADTGTGMTAEVIAQIFEPFFTTKGAGKGTGLGLSMVFGFMKQSGGHITVHSEEGAGTTVRLYLPRAAHAAIEPAPDAPDTAVRSGADATVLVVEDNDTLRRVVLRQVTELGYRVVAARDSAEALTQLERGGIDLLFTDIVMPGEMDGFELTRHVRRHWPGVRVVHTSGFPDARVPTDAVRAQMARILLKPYRKEDLARTLHDALHTPVEAMEDHAV